MSETLVITVLIALSGGFIGGALAVMFANRTPAPAKVTPKRQYRKRKVTAKARRSKVSAVAPPRPVPVAAPRAEPNYPAE